MGRVHKKKLAEYAENEELNKSGGSSDNEPEEKDALAESEGNEVADDAEESNDKVNDKPEEGKDAEDDEEEEDDGDFKSLSGKEENEGAAEAAAEPEKNGKKAPKRKASEKKIQDSGNDSDDEPLNGKAASPAKRGRKPAGAKAKPAAKATKAARKQKAPADDDDNEEEEEEEYEVKEIIDHKIQRGASMFLIRWKGYTAADDTWEPEDTLSCPELIEKYKKKQPMEKKSPAKKSASIPTKGGRGRPANKDKGKEDPEKEWEVDKILDYAEEKSGRVFRIRWKGFGPKHDTWEPEENLYCNDIIEKFMKKMKAQDNVSFKQLREGPKKTKRLVNETAPITNITNKVGRKSKRGGTKQRVYYGDSDD